MTDSSLQDIIVGGHDNLAEIYDKDRVVRFPEALCLPASFMRRITEEVVWSSRSSSSNNNTCSNNSGVLDEYYQQNNNNNSQLLPIRQDIRNDSSDSKATT